MLTTIQLAVDTGYRKRKREELERAKENAIMAGIPVATRAPTGYRKRADRRLEPDSEVAVVDPCDVGTLRSARNSASAVGPSPAARRVKTSRTTAQGADSARLLA